MFSWIELDYKQIQINNQDIYEDLNKEVMRPLKVLKNLDYDFFVFIKIYKKEFK